MPTEMELTLEQTQQGVSYEVSVLSDIEDSHGPSDAMHKPLPATQSRKDFVSKLTEIHLFLVTFSPPSYVDIEKVALSSRLTFTKIKSATIEAIKDGGGGSLDSAEQDP
ncbi:hypothetical protein Tco_0551859 [Tanacetum coccineum]